MRLGSGIRKKTYSGSRGLKRKRIPDPQHFSPFSYVGIGTVILAFDKAEQTVCHPVVDGGPEHGHQGLHVEDREDPDPNA
jgi:hypothetical protein